MRRDRERQARSVGRRLLVGQRRQVDDDAAETVVKDAQQALRFEQGPRASDNHRTGKGTQPDVVALRVDHEHRVCLLDELLG